MTPSRPRPLRRGRSVLTILLGLALLVLPTTFDGAASATAGRPDGPLVPAEGFYVGAYTKHADGYGIDRQKAAIDDLESRLGRRLHIDHQFYSWEDDFPTWREPWDIENGRIPMISWNGTSTAAINGGGYDGLILARAQQLRDLGQPLFLRWFWEMDGNKKANWVGSPQSFVNAWRHIHDLFVAVRATNVVFVWCPNASAYEDGDAFSYYPGPNYVDWICADGYNFAPKRPGDRWRSFDEIYAGFYAAGRKLNKPMMIGEFGVLERNPGEKGQWFHDAHDHLAQKFPAIAALVYFNADSTYSGIYFDWRVDTSPEAFNGFQYLFTGPAPVPRPVGAPPAPQPTPAPTPPAPTTPTVPRSRPRPAVPAAPKPATTPTTSVTPATPVLPKTAPSPEPKAPPAHLTWVLELLRHLDSWSSVAPPGGS